MNNLTFLLSPGDKTQPWYVLAIGIFIFAWLIALVLWRLISFSKQKTELYRRRANAMPICVWTFTEIEWIGYSKTLQNYKDPKGSAEIRFTEFEFCLTDANRTICQVLFGVNLALTDCRITEKRIKARLRSVPIRGRSQSRVYKVNDIYIPIPDGKEADAVKIIDAWKKAMADHADMIAEVTSPDELTGLFGENDF